MTHPGRYKANFTRGGLMVPESRVVADLLLQGVDAAAWVQAIAVDNRLAKRSRSTAVTKARLIRARLQTLPADLWRLVRDGNTPVATQAVFAAALNHSPLVADFMSLVVRELYRRFEPTLKPQHWDRYLEDCHTRDPGMAVWSAGTLRSLRTRVFGMLAEAGYLTDGRAHRLRPLTVAPEVVRALTAAGEHAVLRCMQVSQ